MSWLYEEWLKMQDKKVFIVSGGLACGRTYAYKRILETMRTQGKITQEEYDRYMNKLSPARRE